MLRFTPESAPIARISRATRRRECRRPSRRSFERPIGRRAVVVARFMPLGGRTTASLDLLQAGIYRNPYVGVTFEERCRSTGALEARDRHPQAG